MLSIDRNQVHKTADYVRYLSLMAIEKANSGHPGLPLGCADMGVVLYRYLLRMRPDWPNRDRFVLSAGHGSILLYSLLALSGYKLTLEDLDQFRQWNSQTPGHPELNVANGIETTTGPLGQGFANAVGMAINAKWKAQRYNQKQFPLFDYRVIVLTGDGCNMEGVSYEAASLAGHLGLDNLVAIYDSNVISIDGSTGITFSEDVAARYRSQGWDVMSCNGLDPENFYSTFQKLNAMKGKPKLLIASTIIGSGLNTKRGSSQIHGAPAGVEEIAYFLRNSTMKPFVEKMFGARITSESGKLEEILKRHIDQRLPLWTYSEAFDFMREDHDAQHHRVEEWEKLFIKYHNSHPELAPEIHSILSGKISPDLNRILLEYREEKPDATRNISGRLLNLCAKHIPNLVGGSADLAGSTKAHISGSEYMTRDDFSGNNIAYGIREHAMGSVGNGLCLDGTMIPFSATFFTFMDYMKPPLRMAALMKLSHLFLFSHDSFFLGEDGPTHQPVEHLNSLRLIPGLTTFRPANAQETALAFAYFFFLGGGPVAIVTTRQKVASAAMQGNQELNMEIFSQGAYRFYRSSDKKQDPDLIIVASGSELGPATMAAITLERENNKNVQVISVPSLDLFRKAPKELRNDLLGDFRYPTFLIEAASHRGMSVFYHPAIRLIDIEEFGHSAPGPELGDHLGFSTEKILQTIRSSC